MDLFLVLSIVGSAASIVGLFLPASSLKQKLIHVIYGLAIAGLATTAVWYQQKLSRANDVSRQARELIEARRMEFTNEGFIQAALAFLEKNKDLYPDSYSRAQELCRLHKCFSSAYSDEVRSSLSHGYELSDAASALAGLLRGIAAITRGS